MLNLNYKLLIRFIACWIIPTLIFSWIFWTEKTIIYTHKIGEGWQYERPIVSVIIMSLGLVFGLLSIVYFVAIHFFKIKKNDFLIKISIMFFVAIFLIIALSMNSIGFGIADYFSSIRSLLITILFGTSVPLTDHFIQKSFKKRNE